MINRVLITFKNNYMGILGIVIGMVCLFIGAGVAWLIIMKSTNSRAQKIVDDATKDA